MTNNLLLAASGCYLLHSGKMIQKGVIQSKQQTTSQPRKQNLGVGLMLLDTFWRIAVPVLIFAGIGIVLDRRFHSGPWLSLLGTVIGFVFAGLLIKQELEAAAREDEP